MTQKSNGFWAGIIATGPMTLLLLKLKPMPPAVLTSNLEKTVGIENDDHIEQTSLVSHFMYGGSAGAAYASTIAKLRMNPLIKGGLFGFAVWALSYHGWIRALHFHPQAREMSKQQNRTMLVAHLVWGASLGYCESVLHSYGKQIFTGEKSQALH